MHPDINCLPTTHTYPTVSGLGRPLGIGFLWFRKCGGIPHRSLPMQATAFSPDSSLSLRPFAWCWFFVSRLVLGLLVFAAVLFVLFSIRVWCCAFWRARWFRVFPFWSALGFRVFSFMDRVWCCAILCVRRFRVSFYWPAFGIGASFKCTTF